MGFNNTNRSKLILDGENKGALSAINGVTKQLGSAERQMKGFGSGISGTLGAFTSFLNPTVAISAALTGVTSGMGIMIKSTIDTADELSKMSQRIGISVESLSTLKYAGELADVQFESLTTGLSKLSKNLFDVSNNVGQTAKYGFDALGISVFDSNKRVRETGDLLPEIADKFASMKNGTEKTAIAMTLFGRAGKDLIPLLNEGSEGLAKMQQEARALGLEVSGATGKAAENFNDNLTRLKSTVTGLGIGITTELLPALTDLSDWAVENKGVFTDFIKNSIKEFQVLFYVMNHPDTTTIQKFLADGFNMEIPRGEIKATKEELDNLSKGIQYIVDESGKLIPIKIVSDEEIAKRKLEKFKLDTTDTTKAAEKLQKQWLSVSKTLSNEIGKVGLNDFDKSLYDIEAKVNDLRSKFGDKPLINLFGETVTNSLISEMVKQSFDDILEEEQNFTEQLFEAEETSLAHSIEISMQKRDLIYEEMDLKEKQIEEEKKLQDRRLGSYQDSFGNMAQASQIFYDLSGKQAKAGFAAYKAFSIAETAISTYRAATSALEPYPVGLGPVFGIPLAVSTVALGLANVAKIASMSPGNAGGGGASYSSSSVPTYSNTNSNNNNGQTYVTINVSGNGGGDVDWDDTVRNKIIPAIEKHVSYGGSVRVN